MLEISVKMMNMWLATKFPYSCWLSSGFIQCLSASSLDSFYG